MADQTFDEKLMELVRACRGAAEFHERLRFADEIVVRVGPLVGSFVAARCPEAVAEDLCQEVLIGVARGVPKFRGKTAREFWSWCYRIASRRVADYLRRPGNRPVLSLDVADIRRAVEATVVELPISAEDRADLESALAQLHRSKPPCVEFLRLYFVVGFDYGEIAGMHGTTRDAMRMQIQRCLALARELVGEQV